jgi:hypothetical protein
LRLSTAAPSVTRSTKNSVSELTEQAFGENGGGGCCCGEVPSTTPSQLYWPLPYSHMPPYPVLHPQYGILPSGFVWVLVCYSMLKFQHWSSSHYIVHRGHMRPLAGLLVCVLQFGLLPASPPPLVIVPGSLHTNLEVMGSDGTWQSMYLNASRLRPPAQVRATCQKAVSTIESRLLHRRTGSRTCGSCITNPRTHILLPRRLAPLSASNPPTHQRPSRQLTPGRRRARPRTYTCCAFS